MDLTQYRNDVAAKIAEYGWMVQGVGASEDYPTFAYTVGLTEYGHAELLMIGMSLQTMHTLLNDAARPVKEAGRRYQPGDRVARIVRDYDVLMHGPIDPQASQLFQALHFYPHLEALQMLWPDEKGVFPGEPGFSERFAAVQPVMNLA